MDIYTFPIYALAVAAVAAYVALFYLGRRHQRRTLGPTYGPPPTRRQLGLRALLFFAAGCLIFPLGLVAAFYLGRWYEERSTGPPTSAQ